MSTIFINLILLFLFLDASLSDNQDAKLLLRFKSSLPNPSLLHDWLPSSSHCSFSGLLCNNASEVSALDLSFIPLVADFRSAVSNLFSLNSLHSLSLKSTRLNGKISGLAFPCGAFLTDVDLSNNSISGTVSDLAVFASSCPSLRTLNISLNSILNSNDINDVAVESSLQEIDMSFNRIAGQSDYVFKWLRDLKYISLKGNNLNGRLPAFSHCNNLEHLDLSSNNFTSAMPSLASCSSLRHLDLSSNSFTGELAFAELSELKQLEFLNLSSNRFSGEVSGIPTVGSVKLLNLSGNHFYGALNDDLIVPLCASMIDFDLSYNNLTGTIPPGFAQCVHLESLNLSNNSLTGNLPVDILVKMTNLRNLVLAYNYFLGSLSPHLVIALTFLKSLDLSSNNFSGHIPPGLCSADSVQLKELYLQNNFFSGTIPATLSNCTQLISLDLSFNFLKGGIPQSFNSFADLRDLILWQNDLTGQIPNIGNMRMLESLILDFNDLTGEIPSSLSNCMNLNWISLSNNRLSGPIPSWIGRLSSLAILKLSNNSFYGRIPPDLGNCQSLIWVDLNTNSLTGQIPASLFKQSGKIADALSTRKRYAYIKNDKSNTECHGAGNLLEFVGIRAAQLGRISSKSPCNFPRVYGGIVRPTFNHNGSIIFFDVSYNFLSGVIPKEMGSMFYLQVLHLSHNNLSGQMPPELGALTTLSILDLSHNKLDGIIPSSFSSLSSLVELDLSNNRLYGRIPNSAQIMTFQNYTFLNNSDLCGYPLIKVCDNGGSGLNSSHTTGKKSSHGEASFAGTIAMGLLFSLFCVFGLVMIAVETKKRRAKNGVSSNSTLDVYVGSDSGNHSGWKLTGTREALSINLATFEKPLRKLTFADLLEATNGFHTDTLIGSGGFGDVYRARLKDRTTVAIKKLIHVNGQGDREFNSEMETIGKIKHRNLVPLLGYCKVREERLLVYEYMKYGSLEDVLRDRKKAGIKLNWASRRRIAIGAARGLAFLHHNCNPCIIHRDMKSSNVLLDDDLEARVSDFGMARLMSAMDTHLSVSTLAGTPGYVPPEYYQSFRCTTKGDVYSYGVVLLELLTGRQPTDLPEFGENNNLVGWVKQHATEKMIGHVFDPELIKEIGVSKVEEIELLQHLNVATKCLEERPFYRPTMIQVMAMFKDIQVGGGETMEFESGSTGVVEMSIKECDDELSVNSQSVIDSSCSGNTNKR